MELLERTLPMQGDFFGVDEARNRADSTPRAPTSKRLETRPTLETIKQEALAEIRGAKLDEICAGECATTSIHVLFCQMEKQRSYRLLVTRDLFGMIVIERHWGSLTTRRGGFRRSHFRTDEVASVRKLVFRTLSTRQRHGYELIGQSGV